jgi:hypothetical protein
MSVVTDRRAKRIETLLRLHAVQLNRINLTLMHLLGVATGATRDKIRELTKRDIEGTTDVLEFLKDDARGEALEKAEDEKRASEVQELLERMDQDLANRPGIGFKPE